MKCRIPTLFLSFVMLAWMHNSSADPTRSFDSNDLQLSDFLIVVPAEAKFPWFGLTPTHAGVTNNLMPFSPFLIGTGNASFVINYYSGDLLANGTCSGTSLGAFILGSSSNTYQLRPLDTVYLNATAAYNAALAAFVTPSDVLCIDIQLPNDASNCDLRITDSHLPAFSVTLSGTAFYADTSGSPVSAINCA
ncbi:MAG: hypothetical protein NTW94_08375 [Legionellales bacterium]|nr:hypothetical protein [Legionellales bacterium]